MPLSQIAGLFADHNASQIPYIKGDKQYYRDLLAQQKADVPWYDAQLDNYNLGVTAAQPRVDAARALATSDLQRLFDRNVGYDPYAGPTAYQNTIFKNYTDLAKSVPDWTTKSMDLNAFNLGRGGRGTGDLYNASAISRNIAAQLFPAIASGVSTIPGVSSVAAADRTSNIANLKDIIDRRSGTATQGLDLPLAPINARFGTRNAESAAAQALNEAAKASTAGWQDKPNFAGKLQKSMQEEEAFITSAIQQSLQMMSSMEGGGGQMTPMPNTVSGGQAGGSGMQYQYAQPGYSPGTDWSILGNSGAGSGAAAPGALDAWAFE